MSHITWNSEWIRPYESPWSIFEKFCYANVINRAELLKKFGVCDVQKIKNHVIGEYHQDLRSLRGFEAPLLNQALRFDLMSHVNRMISILETHLPSGRFNWLRTNLAWCEQCMVTGYHSMFHQFVLLNHCPFHMTPLIEKCPECNKNIPFLISDKQLSAPFTCKCGHSMTDLSAKWGYWNNSQTSINCDLTRKWVELSTKKIDDMNHIFIPEYALLNKNVFAYIVHAIDGSFKLNCEEVTIKQTSFNPNYQSWKIDGYCFPKIRTEKPGRMNSRLLVDIFKQYENREFYAFMYENSRQVFKAIDKYIRVTVLKEHKSCVERLHSLLKEESSLFPPICPYAYSYVLWKQSILGYEKFYESMGAYKKADLNTFQLVDKYFSDEQKYLLRGFLENSYNFSLEKPFELKWLVQKIAATYLVSALYAYQSISDFGARQRRAPRSKAFDVLVQDYVPFIIIKHPKNLASGEKITFFEFIKHHRKDKAPICPCVVRQECRGMVYGYCLINRHMYKIRIL